MLKRPLLFVFLVLASGAGILALGLTSLWRGIRSGQAQVREDARRDAAATARALRRSLSERKVLEQLPSHARFAVAAARLVVPEHLQWFVEPPAETPELDLPGNVRDLIARARREAWLEDRVRAQATLNEALAVPGLLPAGRLRVLAAAVWNSWRSEPGARTEELVAELQRSEPVLAWPPSVATSWVLLRAARSEPLPDGTAMLLARLDSEAARAVLARLGEHRVDCTALARAVGEAGAEREVLARATAHLSLLLAERTPTLLPIGGAVLCWFPETADEGHGAWVPAADLVRAARVEPFAGEAVFGAANDPEVLPVLGTTLGIRPRVSATAPALAEPWLLTGLLAVLGLTFALALGFALRAQRREAQALRSRAEFLTSVTHELKTPLASLRLLAEMLDGGRVPREEERQEYYRLMAGESVRLSSLLDNVLDLGRMERGERAYDLRVLDLRALAQEAVELFAPQAAAAGLEVAVAAPAQPLPVRGDRAALDQAVLNVLDNARKYAGPGRRVLVTLTGGEATAQLTVRDFGPGIPESQRERLFGRFVRGVPEGHPAPGVGLGLYLSRSILRGHQGELACETPADGRGGVVFRFTLPLVREAVPA